MAMSEPTTNLYIFERRLLSLRCTGDEDREWSQEAVRKLISRLKDFDALKGLEDALAIQDPNTGCILYPRTPDRDLSPNRRSSEPQVVYCRLWRWPEIRSPNQIKPIGTCSSSAGFNRQQSSDQNTQYVCINPYHYDKISPAKSIQAPRIIPELSTSHEDSDSFTEGGNTRVRNLPLGAPRVHSREDSPGQESRFTFPKFTLPLTTQYNNTTRTREEPVILNTQPPPRLARQSNPVQQPQPCPESNHLLPNRPSTAYQSATGTPYEPCPSDTGQVDYEGPVVSAYSTTQLSHVVSAHSSTVSSRQPDLAPRGQEQYDNPSSSSNLGYEEPIHGSQTVEQTNQQAPGGYTSPESDRSLAPLRQPADHQHQWISRSPPLVSHPYSGSFKMPAAPQSWRCTQRTPRSLQTSPENFHSASRSQPQLSQSYQQLSVSFREPSESNQQQLESYPQPLESHQTSPKSFRQPMPSYTQSSPYQASISQQPPSPPVSQKQPSFQTPTLFQKQPVYRQQPVPHQLSMSHQQPSSRTQSATSYHQHSRSLQMPVKSQHPESYHQPSTSFQFPPRSFQQSQEHQQQPVASYQPPFKSCRQPVESYQQSAASYQKSTESYQQPTGTYHPPSVLYQQLVESCEEPGESQAGIMELYQPRPDSYGPAPQSSDSQPPTSIPENPLNYPEPSASQPQPPASFAESPPAPYSQPSTTFTQAPTHQQTSTFSPPTTSYDQQPSISYQGTSVFYPEQNLPAFQPPPGSYYQSPDKAKPQHGSPGRQIITGSYDQTQSSGFYKFSSASQHQQYTGQPAQSSYPQETQSTYSKRTYPLYRAHPSHYPSHETSRQGAEPFQFSRPKFIDTVPKTYPPPPKANIFTYEEAEVRAKLHRPRQMPARPFQSHLEEVAAKHQHSSPQHLPKAKKKRLEPGVESLTGRESETGTPQQRVYQPANISVEQRKDPPPPPPSPPREVIPHFGPRESEESTPTPEERSSEKEFIDFYDAVYNPEGTHVLQPNQTVVNIQQIDPDLVERWATMTYHEYFLDYEKTYRALKYGAVRVDVDIKPWFADRFPISSYFNYNRHRHSFWVRRKLGSGISISYFDGEVFIDSMTKLKVYVSLPFESEIVDGCVLDKVYKLRCGQSIKVFDMKYFRHLVAAAAQQGYEAVYDLIRFCLIRIGFCKGWGQGYARRYAFWSPVWIEVQLHGAMWWVDKVLLQMDKPRISRITSQS